MRFVLLLMLVGCGDDNDGPPTSDGSSADGQTSDGPAPDGSNPDGPTADASRTVQIGTGITTFEELPPTGGQVELVHGPQGGWHIQVTARIWGDPEGKTLEYRAVRPGETSPVGVVAIILMTDRLVREGDHWLKLGDRLILDIGGADEVVGDTLDLSARLLGPGLGVDTRQAVVLDEEDPG